MDKNELYKIAIQTRNLEIGMFWQRSNYFMVLNTAIAIGFFTQKAGPYGLVLAALGAIVSLLWFFVDLGGKYWQLRWEYRASVYEKEVAPDAELFSASIAVIQKDVEASIVECWNAPPKVALPQESVQTTPANTAPSDAPVAGMDDCVPKHRSCRSPASGRCEL